MQIWPLPDVPAMQVIVELMMGFLPRLKLPEQWYALSACGPCLLAHACMCVLVLVRAGPRSLCSLYICAWSPSRASVPPQPTC